MLISNSHINTTSLNYQYIVNIGSKSWSWFDTSSVLYIWSMYKYIEIIWFIFFLFSRYSVSSYCSKRYYCIQKHWAFVLTEQTSIMIYDILYTVMLIHSTHTIAYQTEGSKTWQINSEKNLMEIVSFCHYV